MPEHLCNHLFSPAIYATQSSVTQTILVLTHTHTHMLIRSLPSHPSFPHLAYLRHSTLPSAIEVVNPDVAVVHRDCNQVLSGGDREPGRRFCNFMKIDRQHQSKDQSRDQLGEIDWLLSSIEGSINSIELLVGLSRKMTMKMILTCSRPNPPEWWWSAIWGSWGPRLLWTCRRCLTPGNLLRQRWPRSRVWVEK